MADPCLGHNVAFAWPKEDYVRWVKMLTDAISTIAAIEDSTDREASIKAWQKVFGEDVFQVDEEEVAAKAAQARAIASGAKIVARRDRPGDRRREGDRRARASRVRRPLVGFQRGMRPITMPEQELAMLQHRPAITRSTRNPWVWRCKISARPGGQVYVIDIDGGFRSGGGVKIWCREPALVPEPGDGPPAAHVRRRLPLRERPQPRATSSSSRSRPCRGSTRGCSSTSTGWTRASGSGPRSRATKSAVAPRRRR